MERRDAPPPETTPTWSAGVRRRLPFYLLAALLLGVLAGVFTYDYLLRLGASALPSAEALVARVDLKVGTTIEETMLELRPVPVTILPSDHLTDPAQAVGRLTLFPIAANEVLLPNRLSGGPESGLAARLPDGRWAMVIPDAWLASPLPELAVGDRIDILAYQKGLSIESAGLIVSAVQVLAIGGPGEGTVRLTVAVTLDEARIILFSRGNDFTLLPLLRSAEG